MTMPIASKEGCRKEILRLREELSAEDRRQKSERICQHIMSVLGSWLKKEEGTADLARRSLFTFIPFGNEVDIIPVLEWAWRSGISVICPRTIPATRQMDLRVVRGWEDVAPGTWGIREPIVERTESAFAKDVGMILVPGVAFDRQGGRLGYGGGYYDRFFAQWGMNAPDLAGHRPMTLAPIFSVQLLDQVPMEPHDTSVDVIITEEGPLTCTTDIV